MKAYRYVSLTLSFFCLLNILSGCSKSKNTQSALKYDTKAESVNIESCVLAENENAGLSFDADAKCLLFQDKKTSAVWSSTPFAEYQNGAYYADLKIRVFNSVTLEEESNDSYACSKINSEKINDGIRLTYYFDEYRISIPIDYTLDKDCLKILIDSQKIAEGNKNYSLLAVTPLPSICSVHCEADDSYLFAPIGSGAVFSNKITADRARVINGNTSNCAKITVESYANASEQAIMKVWGVKAGNQALLGIAQKCEGTVGVNVVAGDKKSDYSTVSPIVFVRDYDYFRGVTKSGGNIKQVSELSSIKCEIGYYMLSGDKADYNGMAKRYRQYLIDNGMLETDAKKLNSASVYNLTFLGGVMTDSGVLGVQTREFESMTSFYQARDIIAEMKEKTGVAPNVRLKGYGKTGINIGEIAGGFEFNKKLGSDSDRQKLEEYCSSSGIQMFTDFNPVYYSESGGGFSYSNDAAQTPVLVAAENSPVNVPMRDFNTSLTYRILGRSKLSDVFKKTLNFANKKGVSSLSFSAFGGITYSDYSDASKYGATKNYSEDAAKNINMLRAEGHKVACDNTAAFLAGITDTVFCAPLMPTGRFQCDYEIPFYEMVFHGYVPMYSTPVNYSADFDRHKLLAIRAGVGLDFSIINDFSPNFMGDNIEKLYVAKYSDRKEYIEKSVKQYKELFQKIKNAQISRYEVIDRNVSKTVYSNGIAVYTNYSYTPVNSPVGELEAYGFFVEEVG